MHMDMKDDESRVSNNLRNAYRTNNHNEAALHLKKTISELDVPKQLDVIHIGERSIHIFLTKNDTPFTIPGGTSDLNQQFDLLQPPNHRQIATCIKWLSCRLPTSLQTFVCIGRDVNALCPPLFELEQDIYCLREDFIHFAQQMAFQHPPKHQEPATLASSNLQNNIALHCVILAGLFKSGASKFMPYLG